MVVTRYDSTMYGLAGLMVVAAVVHSRVLPYIPREKVITTINVVGNDLPHKTA